MDAHRKSLKQRMVEYTKRADNGCLMWIGLRSPRGYARTKPIDVLGNGVKYERVSRALLALKLKRDLAVGEFAMHTCDVTSCVERRHIVLGNALLNNRDTVAKGRYRNGHNKVDEAVRSLVEELYDEGNSQEVIANIFNISQVRVSQILRGL